MRLLYLTANLSRGCRASTMRDIELTSELERRGVRVTLLPLFSRPNVDGAPATDERVYFSRAGLYLQERAPALRWTPPVLDRLWDHSRVIDLFDRHPFDIDHRTFRQLLVSVLRGRDGAFRKEFDKFLDAIVELPRPDVVCVSSAWFTSLAQPIKQAIGRPVVSHLFGLDTLLELWPARPRYEGLESLRRHVEHVDGFLASSTWHASLMRDWLAIPPRRIHLAPGGVVIDADGVQPRSAPGPRGPRLGYLGRIAPEKGLHVLCDAYIRLRTTGVLPCGRLEVAGHLDAEHVQYFEDLRSRLASAGLLPELTFHGRLGRRRKAEFLRTLDVMSVPSTYAELDARAVTEALGFGVPVVQPSRGVFPQLVEESGGGVLVAPDDPNALADGLMQLLADDRRHREAADRGAAHVRATRTVAHEAERFLEACATVRPSATRAA